MKTPVRFATLGGALAAVILSAGVSRAVPPPPAASYTTQQAWQGRLEYYRSCAECHGGTLGGQFGPALAGGDDNLKDQSVKDVFDYMSAHMPHGNPEGLPERQYLAIMAFMLQAHGVPAGSRSLTKASVEADKRLMSDTR